MTKKLFHLDQYLKEFFAKVESIDGNRVVLDQTAFYATAGGQTGDTGEINGIKVVETVYDNGNIVHVLEKEPDFKIGDRVKGKINWDRRHYIMRLHSACHIVSGIVWKHFENAKFTGSNIYSDRARMDFNIEKLDDEVAKFIEDESNKIVEHRLPIIAKITTWEETEKDPTLKRVADELYQKYDVPRTIEIKDFDKQLDGGTHVANTKEIGKIKIVKRENKGKNNRRIYIIVE